MLGGVLLVTPDSTPRFAAVQGQQLAKAFHRTLEVQLEEATLELRGKDGAVTKGPLQHRLSYLERQEVELVDEYLAVEDGQPARLRRTLGKLAGTLKARDLERGESTTEEGNGALEGARVLFTLDPDAAAYVPSFESPGEHDAALLETPEEDADLRGILPDRPVAAGDQWKADPELLRRLCRPGGAIAYEDSQRDQVFLEPWLDGRLNGSLSVRHAGEVSVAGARVALLEITGRVETCPDPVESEEGPFLMFGTLAGTDRTERRAELVVEGEARWDLEAGCLLDAELDAQVVLQRETHGVAADGEIESWTRERWTGRLRAGASFR